jgi:hypothetical protein
MFRYEQRLVTLSPTWPRSGVRQPLKPVCRTEARKVVDGR